MSNAPKRLAIIAVLVAIVAWIMPFKPTGDSPLISLRDTLERNLQIGDQPAESSMQPTGLTSSSSQAKYPCPMLITQDEVDSWKLGQTDVQTVHRFLDQFDSKRPDDAGAFVAGMQIPAEVLVATNYDTTDASKWTQYGVVPIVHSGSWGLFQTTREYAAPQPGACMTIIPSVRATQEQPVARPTTNEFTPPARPSGVTIPAGGTFTPIAGWIWICTGDFSVVRSDSKEIVLHDDLESTGLVLVLEQNGAVTVKVPHGGYCEPFSQEEKSNAISAKVAYLMNREGCNGTCSEVNVKELDTHGDVMRDYWRP